MPYFTKHSIQQVFKKYHFKPDKIQGQCFLIDKNICTKMVNEIEFEEGYDRVMEIGPGFGAFSDPIANKSRLYYLIEQDSITAKYLESHFQKKFFTSRIEFRNIRFLGYIPKKTKITVVEGDILSIPWPEVDYIVSNLPFGITYNFILKLIQNWSYRSAILIIQRDLLRIFAAKEAKSGYGVLSVLFQLFFQIITNIPLSSESFFPIPEVQTSLIRVEPKANLNEHSPGYISGENRNYLIQFVCDLFRYKNKTFHNGLKLLEKEHPSFFKIFPHLHEVISQLDLLKHPINSVSPEKLQQICSDSRNLA